MNELPNLIDYSTSDFVKWQEEREAMRQEMKSLKEQNEDLRTMLNFFMTNETTVTVR